MTRARGFTLIELLVVIAIIGLLSAVVLAALTTARNTSTDGRRVSDMNSVRDALQIYSNNHSGLYPATCGGASTCSSASYFSQCTIAGVTTQSSASAVIPGIVADGAIGSVPMDPQMSAANGSCCYLYKSTGTDYKLIVGYNCSTANYYNPALKLLLDPARVGSNGYPATGNLQTGWATFSPGGAAF